MRVHLVQTKANAGQIRMQKDLSELTLSKGVELEFHKGADNLMEFKVHVSPDDGMYRGGKFSFDFKVPATYPHDPPKVLCETTVRAAPPRPRARARAACAHHCCGAAAWRGRSRRGARTGAQPRPAPRRAPARPPVPCLAQVYHPNIDMEGHVCLNILREDWKPVLTINSVIYGLTFLMLEPNADDPLNKEAAQLLESNRRQFEQVVRRSLRGGMMRVGDKNYTFASLVRD